MDVSGLGSGRNLLKGVAAAWVCQKRWVAGGIFKRGSGCLGVLGVGSGRNLLKRVAVAWVCQG
jgi:hypothetical protein